ncbi:MAG: hypothetical protein ACYC9M_05960 [Desulfobulbaceae bacterium]
MEFKLLRLYALLVQAAFCLFVFAVGIVSHISFFNTFIGPALILLIIAFKPNFYYDIIALFTIGLLVILSLIFAFVSAAVLHQHIGIAIVSPLIPVACLATVIYCMDRLKKGDEAYS